MRQDRTNVTTLRGGKSHAALAQICTIHLFTLCTDGRAHAALALMCTMHSTAAFPVFALPCLQRQRRDGGGTPGGNSCTAGPCIVWHYAHHTSLPTSVLSMHDPALMHNPALMSNPAPKVLCQQQALRPICLRECAGQQQLQR
eukprot:1160820-Pelagomonas_calceolata.AAC.7